MPHVVTVPCPADRIGLLFAPGVLLAVCASLLAAEPVRVEVSRDAWISAYPSEREGNNGGAPRLKLKGIQEFFLIDFDPAALRGKRVTRASLHLRATGQESLGRTTVSSVAEPWEEGTGSGYARTPGASSFAWAATDRRPWRDVDLTGSINGSGGSIWGFGDPSPRDADGWQAIPIDPAVVQARIDGVSHGFCVMDDVGNEYTRDGDTFRFLPFPNRFFSSRDDSPRKAPYFTLWLEDGAAPPAVSVPVAVPAARAGRLPPEVTPPAAPAGTRGRDLFGAPLESLEFFAARGEAIGFSIDGGLEGVSIDLPVRRFAMPEVAGFVDPLVPSPDGRFVEVLVPKDVFPLALAM